MRKMRRHSADFFFGMIYFGDGCADSDGKMRVGSVENNDSLSIYIYIVYVYIYIYIII